jgi:hypothetical protein
MTLTLASTWHPRGENQRLLRLWPALKEAYGQIVFCLHPESDPAEVNRLSQAMGPSACFVIMENWTWGRYEALRLAAGSASGPIHYADIDRLLRWVERLPVEWRQTLEVIAQSGCLVIGRTPAAYNTHPQALIRTERLSNLVVSRLLGQDLDLSAGSKGFSLAAARYILANSTPGRAMGADAEWPILCQRAGLKVDGCRVDGLDWESADRYQDQAADASAQTEAARLYDQDAEHWLWRVQVAEEIIQSGLDAMHRPLKPIPA